jgi:predicted lactoylglutathione lyase
VDTIAFGGGVRKVCLLAGYVQVSFLAASEAQVREVWALAIEMGGTNEGKPGFREYASDFYAAYCRDPEGNKLCFAYAPDP